MSSNSNSWKEAMNEETEALIENETFEYTKLLPDKILIGSRRVYTIKSGPSEKYKANFVAKGYSQIPYMDYCENRTFLPTARLT